MTQPWPDPRYLSQALIEEGLVPKECGDIQIHLGVDQAVRLKYEVFIDVTDLAALSRAFAKVAERLATERKEDKL